MRGEILGLNMSSSTQDDYKETTLDPALLSTPFKVQTNWHVISGAQSSGKTTLIDLLAAEGFQTFPEPGRQFFERELAKGRIIADIRQDRAAMTRQIYALSVKLERGYKAADFTFLDRGLPDALAFYRFAGMDPNEILPDCFQHRYASVFLLKRLPYQQDGIRAGDDASAAYFETWIERDYRALGYNVIRVPLVPPKDRLAFVLERLSARRPW
jgi:predicted ATPase